jgi:hypothetical protein
MNIRIPRWILWRERNTIEDFLCEPIYRMLHEAFYYFEKEPMLFPMEEVAILNEGGLSGDMVMSRKPLRKRTRYESICP